MDAGADVKGKDPWKGDLSSQRGTKNRGRPKGSTEAGSLASVAKASGRSKSSVDRDLKRAKALGPEVLSEVAGANENLIHHNLTPAEEARAVVERATLLERIEEREWRTAEEVGEVSPQLRDNLPKTHKSTGKGRGKGGGRKAKAASDKAVAALKGHVRGHRAPLRSDPAPQDDAWAAMRDRLLPPWPRSHVWLSSRQPAEYKHRQCNMMRALVTHPRSQA